MWSMPKELPLLCDRLIANAVEVVPQGDPQNKNNWKYCRARTNLFAQRGENQYARNDKTKN